MEIEGGETRQTKKKMATEELITLASSFLELYNMVRKTWHNDSVSDLRHNTAV